MHSQNSSIFIEEEQQEDVFHYVLFYPPQEQHIESYKKFELQLNKIRSFLQTLFCNTDEINAEPMISSIFRQASAIRLKSLKIALLSLLICFRRDKFIQDFKAFQSIEFTKQRQQYINTIVNIISNYPTTNINNSISDIEQCIPEILAKEFTFMRGVFSYIDHKQTKRMFYQYLMNPSDKVSRSQLTQSLKKLTLYIIQQWQQNSINQNSIFKLKLASQKPEIPGRYYYSFLWEIQNRNKAHNKYDCWLVCVQTTKPLKQLINVDKRLLEKQAFLGIDQRQSAQLQNRRSSIKKSKTISQIIEQQEKQFKRLSQIFEDSQNKNNQYNTIQQSGRMGSKNNKKAKSQQKGKVSTSSTSQINQSSEQLEKNQKARQEQIQPKEPKKNVPNPTTPKENEQDGEVKIEWGEVHNSFNFNRDSMVNEYRFLAFVTVFILVMLFFNVIYV